MKLETARQFDPGWKPTIEADPYEPVADSGWSEVAGAIVLFVFVLCLLFWGHVP